MGIHYDYKSTKSAKLMEKQAKRERKLAEKKAKKAAKEGLSVETQNKTIDVDNNTVSNIEVDNLKSGVLDTDITSVSSSDDT